MITGIVITLAGFGLAMRGAYKRIAATVITGMLVGWLGVFTFLVARMSA